MPRIPLGDIEDAPPEVRAAYDRFMQVRGNIPNLFRTLALRPEIMLTANAHMDAVINSGTLPPSLKEMCIVRTSYRNDCAY